MNISTAKFGLVLRVTFHPDFRYRLGGGRNFFLRVTNPQNFLDGISRRGGGEGET